MSNVSDKAIQEIVKEIIDDLSDRFGVDLYRLDTGTIQEIKYTWENIIEDGIRNKLGMKL